MLSSTAGRALLGYPLDGLTVACQRSPGEASVGIGLLLGGVAPAALIGNWPLSFRPCTIVLLTLTVCLVIVRSTIEDTRRVIVPAYTLYPVGTPNRDIQS